MAVYIFLNFGGKSAILTALMVALGGKATSTNRASSVSKLLKEGENVGQVIVKIRNSGPDAFRPDQYGDVITVERKIQRDGPATYRIKSQLGKIVSDKRAELTALCDHLQIDVDNPMAILTQDTAKMFLANSTPKEKYQFFLKGTQLERLMHDYSQMEERLESMRKTIERKAEVLPEILQRLNKKEVKWKEMNQAQDLEAQLNHLQAEQIWSKVTVLEKKKDEAKVAFKNLEKKLTAIDERVRAIDEQIQEKTNLRAGLDERMRAAKAFLDPLKSKLNDFKAKQRDLQRKLDQQNQEKADLQSDINRNTDTINDLQRRIDEETKKLSIDHREANRLVEQKIQELENQKEQLESSFEQYRRDVDDLNQKILDNENEGRRVDAKIRDLNGECCERKNRIRNLEQQKHDALLAFGRNMPRIIRAIEDCERKGLWTGAKPIGPFGAYIKLDKRKYQKVIESLLNNMLNAFGVENPQDFRLLQRILRDHETNATIYKYEFRKNFDFSNGMPSKDLTTVLSVLQIDNEVVLQQLIINSNIEKAVLVDTPEEGDRLTRGKYPDNVNAVYTPDCFQIGSRNGGLGTFAVKTYNGPPRLSPDLDAVLSEYQDQLRDKEFELQNARSSMDRLKHEHHQLKNEFLHREGQLSQIRGNVARIENQIEHQRQSMQENDPANLVVLNEHLTDAMTQRGVNETQLLALNAAFEEDSRKKEELERESRSIVNSLKEEDQSIHRITAETGQFGVEISKLETDKHKYALKKPTYEKQYQEAYQILNTTQEALATQTEQCLAYSERVEVTRSQSEIDAEVRKVSALLKEKEREYGSRQAFHKELISLRKHYAEASKDVQESEEIFVLLSAARQMRSKKFEKFKQIISTRSKRLFAELIKKRGHRGVLELNHNEGTLELRVDINATGVESERTELTQSSGKDPRSLSGGEKSYATICLLLALWEAMASPFRALDEFDVFMDAVNRRVAIKLIIEHAREAPCRSQYILISPISSGNGDFTGPDVRIHRLNPPERGQSTLNFNRANQ